MHLGRTWPGPLIKYFKYQTGAREGGREGGGLQLIGSQAVSRWDEKNQQGHKAQLILNI